MMQSLSGHVGSRVTQRVRTSAHHGSGIGTCCALIMACVVVIAPDGIAQAQVVERNLPPEPPRRASAIKIDTNDLLKSDDATPLGVNVQAIVLIGANVGAKPASGVKGVDVSEVSGLDAAALREQLTPFVDRPLSRKLIAEVQAAIAAAYREAGRPFVSVTLPPQEVSSGVLQLRVIVFKVAGIKVTGAAAENYPPSRIRLVPGQEIDARKLETDLDWANRNPFRQVEAVFGPGKDLGMTDVNIQVTDRKPWQVYAGYANSGTLLTDRNRYYVGASGAPSADVFASYQLTGSGNFWVTMAVLTARRCQASSGGAGAHAASDCAPVSVVGDHVLTNERPNNLFRSRLKPARHRQSFGPRCPACCPRRSAISLAASNSSTSYARPSSMVRPWRRAAPTSPNWWSDGTGAGRTIWAPTPSTSVSSPIPAASSPATIRSPGAPSPMDASPTCAPISSPSSLAA
jgi:hypothetical protein